MNPGFTIEKKPVKNGTGATYLLRGWLNGVRIRKQFRDRDQAEGEKAKLEIEATNSSLRAVVTRLTERQVAEAESAVVLLGETPLLAAVRWYLANFSAACAEIPVETARDAFIADREPNISPGALKDYKRTLR